MCQKRRVFLGLFASEEDAARAYDRTAQEFFGPFAILNFPGERGIRLAEIKANEVVCENGKVAAAC